MTPKIVLSVVRNFWYTFRGIVERENRQARLAHEDTMSKRPMSKNAKMLKFFLQQSPARGLGQTRLQKLAYLADLESRKLLGQPISDFKYVFHHYGPFDSALYDAIDELLGNEYAIRSEIDYGQGFVEKRVRDTGHAALMDFAPAELEILSFIVEKYMRTPLKSLLDDVVYETEPMKKVERRGQRLPMDEMNDVEKKRLGFDLEKVIEAERGSHRPAKDFFDELRAKIRARS